MACYPLKEMIARAFGKKKRRSSHRLMYSPPPAYSQNAYSHKRATVVKTVNFSNHNPVFVIPPEVEPGLGPPVSNSYPEPIAIPPSGPGPGPSKEHEAAKPKRSKRTRFAPGPEMQDHMQSGPTQHRPHSDHHGPIQHGMNPGYCGSAQREPNVGHHGAVPLYAPSPLPRWEYGQGRQEYFSGEYRYYPTPIREGIYSIATDPHRLTTIFSEENPNACTIV